MTGIVNEFGFLPDSVSGLASAIAGARAQHDMTLADKAAQMGVSALVNQRLTQGFPSDFPVEVLDSAGNAASVTAFLNMLAGAPAQLLADLKVLYA